MRAAILSIVLVVLASTGCVDMVAPKKQSITDQPSPEESGASAIGNSSEAVTLPGWMARLGPVPLGRGVHYVNETRVIAEGESLWAVEMGDRNETGRIWFHSWEGKYPLACVREVAGYMHFFEYAGRYFLLHCDTWPPVRDWSQGAPDNATMAWAIYQEG